MKSKKILAFIFSLVIVGAAYFSPHLKKYVKSDVVSADEYIATELQEDEEELQDDRMYHGVLWIADFDEQDEVDSEGFHDVSYAFDEAEEDGEMFAVTLKVNQDAKPGDYEIGFGKEGSFPCLCSTYEEYDTEFVPGVVSVGKEAYERPQKAADLRTTVSFEDVVCEAGETITVKAVIAENQGISAYNLFINYDPDVFSVVGIRPCGEFTEKGEFSCSENIRIITETEENEVMDVVSSDDVTDSENADETETANTDIYEENEEDSDIPEYSENDDVPADTVTDDENKDPALQQGQTEEIDVPAEHEDESEDSFSEEVTDTDSDVNDEVSKENDNDKTVSEDNDDYGWETVEPGTKTEIEKTDEEIIAEKIENGDYSSVPDYRTNAVLWIADTEISEDGVRFNENKEDGRVFSVTFKVNENANDGDYEISFAEDELSQSFSTTEGDMSTVYRSGIISIGGIAPIEDEKLSDGEDTVVFFTNESASKGQYVTIYAEIKNNAGTAAFNSYIRYDSSVFSIESIDACGGFAQSGEFMTN